MESGRGGRRTVWDIRRGIRNSMTAKFRSKIALGRNMSVGLEVC